MVKMLGSEILPDFDFFVVGSIGVSQTHPVGPTESDHNRDFLHYMARILD